MHRNRLASFLFVLLLLIFLAPVEVVRAESIDPQYIFVRKDNTCSNCYNWSGFDPSVINMQAVNEIFGAIGSKGSTTRKLGIGVLFFYNQIPLDNLKASLNQLLNLAQSPGNEFPVFIAFDGFQWWDSRPDLWNWFDSSQPFSYNLNNRQNVEWTCASPSCAITKSWRNWGTEIEVKPHPNLASRTFIDTNKQRLSQLIPPLVTWYNQLPADKKWLLGGIDIGTETDIGHNYYYYKNGKKGSRLSSLGYAAVTTLNLPGGLTAANSDEVVRRYTNELDLYVQSLGIPRSKVFNHIHPGQVLAAVTGSGYPGWSLYGGHADQPKKLPGLDTALNQAASAWASPEWLTGATTTNGWITALRNTLNYRNNKFLNIANWENVRNKPYVISALKTVLAEAPSCAIALPTVKITTTGSTATFTWEKGANNNALYLNISDTNSYTSAGMLSKVNIANVNITTLPSYTTSNLSPGTYYWLIAADGCGNQRKITTGSYTISGGTVPIPTATPTPTPKLIATPNPKPTPTFTPTPVAGDFDGDGHVTDSDVNKIKNNFGNPFTIFDYNLVVTNYGR